MAQKRVAEAKKALELFFCRKLGDEKRDNMPNLSGEYVTIELS